MNSSGMKEREKEEAGKIKGALRGKIRGYHEVTCFPTFQGQPCIQDTVLFKGVGLQLPVRH